MSIAMRSLLPETYRALEKLSEQRQWAPIFPWMEPEQVAWLAAKLKYVPDGDDFPRGKWATIQRLQDLVDDAALKAVAVPQDTQQEQHHVLLNEEMER